MTDMYECKIDLVIGVTSTERKIKITGRIVLCLLTPLLTPHSSLMQPRPFLILLVLAVASADPAGEGCPEVKIFRTLENNLLNEKYFAGLDGREISGTGLPAG